MQGARTTTVIAATIAATLSIALPAYSYPAYWIAQAKCIHYWETGHRTPTVNAAWGRYWNDTGNPSSRGGMQFLYSTWASLVARHHLHGYPHDPASATRAQQVYAAWLLWKDDGGSWHEWSTAYGCGLR